jgi:hypothetical protein
MTTGKTIHFRNATGLFTTFVGMALISILLDRGTQTCSVFCIGKANNLVVGRNQDWDFGEVELVVDWKSDVAPGTQTRLKYRSQVSDYLSALGVQRGVIVYMTSGEIDEVAL